MQPERTDAFVAFATAVHQRLEAGSKEYADRSFDLPLPELIAEIREEVADICGWSFLVWHRLNALEKAARAAESQPKGTMAPVVEIRRPTRPTDPPEGGTAA